MGTVTIRPHAATANDTIISTAKTSRRITLVTPAARSLAVTVVCAAALHLAFPRTGWWWIVPLALAGLYATWSSVPPRAAALLGYVAGAIFLTLDFSWFGETAGRLLGPFALIIPLGPALGDAFAFAFAAFVTSVAARRCPQALAPLVGAAAFTAGEWARSSGVLAVPFGQLGLPLVDSPLRPLAAYVGGFGLTLVTAGLAAYLAAALLDRRRWPAFAAAVAVSVALCGIAWLAWPARHLAPPTERVAAIQGNIRQEIKATTAAQVLAVRRYTAMTLALAPEHPAYILWPETVIVTDMGSDPVLRARFSRLARQVGAELAVGTLVHDPVGDRWYNAVVAFQPDGTIGPIVGKRQLVPFAEWIPGPAWLRNLPFADEVNDLTPGSGPQLDRTSGVGTLICWESVFGDIAAELVRDGARFLAVTTDDGWFGRSDGPYQHAQATTLRAVETGRWIVRAAATGFSGIVAPDGSWRERSGLETQETILGRIGAPVPTPYPWLAPGVPVVLLSLCALAFVPWPRQRA